MEHLSELPSELSEAKPEAGRLTATEVEGSASLADAESSLAPESRRCGSVRRRRPTSLPLLSLDSSELATCNNTTHRREVMPTLLLSDVKRMYSTYPETLAARASGTDAVITVGARGHHQQPPNPPRPQRLLVTHAEMLHEATQLMSN